MYFLLSCYLIFQSTPSAWRETTSLLLPLKALLFQSTPSAWRETIACSGSCAGGFVISIHSLRMEGDIGNHFNVSAVFNFNPLPPHGGRRFRQIQLPPQCHFNPLPPHGGRRGVEKGDLGGYIISIHSLRMEGDELCCFPAVSAVVISIHSLRMEGDRWRAARNDAYCQDFNPLPPHGGRLSAG